MAYPKAYEPIEGQMYQILVWNDYDRSYDHCDYAEDRQEKDTLLKEYRMAYGNGSTFKTILLPKKYHKK